MDNVRIEDSYTPGDWVDVVTAGRQVYVTSYAPSSASAASEIELNVEAARRLRRVLKAAIKEIENR